MKLSILFIILGIGAMFIAGGQHDRLDDMAFGEDRDYLEVSGGISPTVKLVTVMLGPFRGVLADIMWVRASRLQDEGKVFELVQLADWITKLEPRFAAVWDYHGWNLAYNVSVMFPSADERWRWVRAGLVLLRDGGLRYNPTDPGIHRSLAWTYQHKLGFNSDNHHRYYKAKWFNEIESIIPRGRIDYDALPEDVFAETPPDYDALLADGTITTNQHRMVVDYKLEPLRTRRIDQQYGPLDWRNVLTHAIYWADRGLEFAEDTDAERLHQILFQSMKSYFEQGIRVEVPDSDLMYFEPDFSIVPKVEAIYERAQNEFPDRQTFFIGHRHFLQAAARKYHAYGRENDAKRMFQKMLRLYPDEVEQKDYESFIKQVIPDREVFDALTPAQVGEIVMNELIEAEKIRAVGGDPIAANAAEVEALDWHKQHAASLEDEPNRENRVGLPPFEDLKKFATEEARRQIVVDTIIAPLRRAERLDQNQEGTPEEIAALRTQARADYDKTVKEDPTFRPPPFEALQDAARGFVEDEIRAAKEALEQAPGNL